MLVMRTLIKPIRPKNVKLKKYIIQKIAIE